MCPTHPQLLLRVIESVGHSSLSPEKFINDLAQCLADALHFARLME
jgi:hypothetical protein